MADCKPISKSCFNHHKLFVPLAPFHPPRTIVSGANLGFCSVSFDIILPLKGSLTDCTSLLDYGNDPDSSPEISIQNSASKPFMPGLTRLSPTNCGLQNRQIHSDKSATAKNFNVKTIITCPFSIVCFCLF